MEAALPAQQPLRHHVERMTQLYQLDRVQPRAPALPAHDLCLTVARQFGKLAAIHVGLGHRTRQALADPLLLGSEILFRHRRASRCPTVAYTKMLGDGRLSRATGCAHGMRQRRCSGRCRMMRSGSSPEERTRKTRLPPEKHSRPNALWRLGSAAFKPTRHPITATSALLQ